MREQSLILDLENILIVLGFIAFLIFLVSLILILYREIHRNNNADIAESSFSVSFTDYIEDAESGENLGARTTKYTGFKSEGEAYDFYEENRFKIDHQLYCIDEETIIK